MGYANSNGLPALKDNIAKEDSPVVSNLRKAGTVVIARTNAPEFSYRYFSSNPLHGSTSNPSDTVANNENERRFVDGSVPVGQEGRTGARMGDLGRDSGRGEFKNSHECCFLEGGMGRVFREFSGGLVPI